MLNHYEILKKYYENGIYGFLRSIERDPSSPYYGTAPNFWSDSYDSSHFYYRAFICVVGYYLPDAKCFRDDELLRVAEDILCGSERYIHEDGTIDLRTTNFHDPSYCAFAVRDCLGPALEVIKKYTAHTPAENKVEAHLTSILSRMGRAMETLGFHTPNHRWVICSALSYVEKFVGDENARPAMEKFFWEGIDCDEYGEYTERSTGMYNRVCNQSFLQLAHIDDKKFLEYPIKNMRLMRSFYEPDGTICTLNSMRQDRGKSARIDDYYIIYLPLALYTEDEEFAYYADRSLRELMAREITSDAPFECLNAYLMYWLLVEDEWRTNEKFSRINSRLPSRDLNIYLPESGAARVFRNGATITVLRTSSPDFFKFQMGEYGICARMGGSFFGQPHSQFRPKIMEKTESGFRLVSNEEAGYRSQFDEPPKTSVWRHMDHSMRRIINVQRFLATADVSFGERDVTLNIEFGGVDDVPTKLELTMAPGMKIETDSLNFISRADDYVYFKNGKMKIRGGLNVEIEGGSYRHLEAENMRGTEHVPQGCFTVCLTGATPCKMRLTIRY